MAKVSFNKLNLQKTYPVETINWNDQNIEVKTFLPMEDKLDLISKIINYSVDDNNYYNPCRIDIFKKILIIEAYTNISITDKQKESVGKLYDMIYNNGLFDSICEKINKKDLEWIHQSVQETVQSIYAYKNSVMGILDAIKNNYSNLEFDAKKIQELLGDENNLDFLRDVLDRLG